MRSMRRIAARLPRLARRSKSSSSLLQEPPPYEHPAVARAWSRGVDAHVAADKRTLWHPYTSMAAPAPALAVARASGVTLELECGATLVDGMSSWWACVHGYGVPELDGAAADQLSRMSHVMFGGLTHRPAVALGDALVDVAPAGLEKVFLCDSGSVAVEVALKMAAQYWRGRGRPARTRVVALRGGYHGDTFGAMAVCDPDTGMHAAFGGAVAAQLHAPRPPAAGSAPAAVDGAVAALDALVGAHADEVGALILEPLVQGAGGMFFYDPAYLRGAKAVCEKHDVLLVADEIATGFGRAGRGHAFACDRAGVAPDIMCVGKALTGGYCTLGATLATAEVAAGVSAAPAGGPPLPLMHGPTFMANPLACAIAGASLSLLFRPDASGAPWWRARVDAIEAQLAAELAPAAALPAVADVRVLGAIGVVELHRPLDAAAVSAACVDLGVWLRPFGRNLYTMPPYVAEPADIAKIAGAMRWIAEHLADAPEEASA